MKSPQSPSQPLSPAALWPALALTAVAIAYRVLLAWRTSRGDGAAWDWLPGFYPLAAIALCGGRFLPRTLAFAAPLGLLLVSDFVADWLYHASFFSPQVLGRYVCLLGLVQAGLWLRARAGGAGALLLATLGGAAFFYLVTNSLSWMDAPEYAKTFSGWAQALTTGLPGYLSTWIFFRNALVSDLLYSMLMIASVRLGAERIVSTPRRSARAAAAARF